jgi:1,2-diacylglycerol 3-beta-galactosyltransferase
MSNTRRILILMSDTGGGHRAAAEAICDALKQRHGEAVEIEVVDVFRAYTSFPFKYASKLYPWWIKNGKLMWRVGYRVTNRRGQVRLLMSSLGRAIRRGMRRLLASRPDVDAIVCVHPLFSNPTMKVLRSYATRPPVITVVTDLVSTHAFWYERSVDRILVPTQPAYDRGLRLGIRPEQMRVTGLPVHPNFAEGLIGKAEARTRLGWDRELPTILVVGGGEGMGPVFRIARRINRLGARCQLAIVAGRNRRLRARLEAQGWNQPTHIFPFVINMPELMAASDILVTKAGPATISEACMAGLPMILSDAIPGQEDGNISYVVAHQAGVYAPGPARVARAVRDWLAKGPDYLRERGENAHELARPGAVWDIADEVWYFAQRPRITQVPVKQRTRRFRLRRPGWRRKSKGPAA